VCSIRELTERFSELTVGLLPFLFPGKIPRVEDNSSADLCGDLETVGHHLDTCPADGLEEAGNVHPMIGSVEDKVCGITLEESRVGYEMRPLVYHFDQAGETRKLVQRHGQRLVKETVTRDAQHAERWRGTG
jgi:hypothetical protein